VAEHLFADGLGAVSVIGATVRLDFFCFSATEKDANGHPKAVLEYRLVLPHTGFLQLAGKLQEAANSITNLKKAASLETEKKHSSNPQPESADSTNSPKSLFP
jgi:hypothetical protein